jgi:N-acetylglucosaminyldiphosphoundecaprenol N-acetyl-beta-D-mannosaminyltransferase
LAFALHIGGMNHRRNSAFAQALELADIVYADGVAIVALARFGGAKRIERSPTTDIGHSVITLAAKRAGRPLRVALVGGPQGLADAAGEELVRLHGITVVCTAHGYRDNWEQTLAELRASSPDIVFVGLGMPGEAEWAAHSRDVLPPCIVMTCGGWFGFLAGKERRAPRFMRLIGLEWLARLLQNPRLVTRYLTGIGTVTCLVPAQMVRRWHLRLRGS